jgi:hypothetical protein
MPVETLSHTCLLLGDCCPSAFGYRQCDRERRRLVESGRSSDIRAESIN